MEKMTSGQYLRDRRNVGSLQKKELNALALEHMFCLDDDVMRDIARVRVAADGMRPVVGLSRQVLPPGS